MRARDLVQDSRRVKTVRARRSKLGRASFARRTSMSKQLNEAHEALIAYALSFPSAFEDHPWGERVAKVGKKIFVFFGRGEANDPKWTVVVKLPVSGVNALDLPFAEPTGYGLGKSGWVSATFRPEDHLPIDLMRAWILESYRAIAPKKLLKELDGAADKALATESVRKPSAQKKRGQQKPSAKEKPARRNMSAKRKSSANQHSRARKHSSPEQKPSTNMKRGPASRK
jgi:predicted DNA-binding protein (MmcQ/YjbR family)